MCLTVLAETMEVEWLATILPPRYFAEEQHVSLNTFKFLSLVLYTQSGKHTTSELSDAMVSHPFLPYLLCCHPVIQYE